MQLQKTMFNSQNLKKTAFTDFRKLSQNDFKTAQIDKILLTQSNALSLIRVKSIKTKLPQLALNSTQSTFSSQNGRIGKLCASMNELEQNMFLLNQELSNIKSNANTQSHNLKDQLQKTSNLLKKKIERLNSMVEYTMSQDKLRTNKIKEVCTLLEDSSRLIKDKIQQAKDKMQMIEQLMGVYTGEDKHFL